MSDDAQSHDMSTERELPVAAIILAAGLGTRMKSSLPKVLHEVCGRPMVSYVVDAALSLQPTRLVVVTGVEHDEVEALLPVGCERAIQAERLGTGDAVRAGMEPLLGFDGDVVVLVGDAPLVDGDFLRGLIADHRRTGCAATVATAVLESPGCYGRIARAGGGEVQRIVEARDASPEQLAIGEVNTGFYVFAADHLRRLLPRLQRGNAQGELYLTDVVHLMIAEGHRVAAYQTPDPEVMAAVNSRVELAQVNGAMRRRLLERLMLAGVTIMDPASTYLDYGVEVGRDTIVHPQSYLYGHTQVGAAAEIGPGTYLRDVFVGDRARIVNSYLTQCVIGSGCFVGPFAHIRPNTVLREGAGAGTFVEIKNSTVGERSKVPHLSYIGDTVIGKDTNIGAGNITANFDGFQKHATTVGDNVKTGSNTTMVAPVAIGDGAFTAAGSVITEDVPADALGVARSRQQNLSGYGRRRRERHLGAQQQRGEDAR